MPEEKEYTLAERKKMMIDSLDEAITYIEGMKKAVLRYESNEQLEDGVSIVLLASDHQDTHNVRSVLNAFSNAENLAEFLYQVVNIDERIFQNVMTLMSKNIIEKIIENRVAEEAKPNPTTEGTKTLQ